MSHIRVVHDPIVLTHCLQPAPDSQHLCLRLRDHNGGCVAWNHWPRKDITRDNPASTRKAS